MKEEKDQGREVFWPSRPEVREKKGKGERREYISPRYFSTQRRRYRLNSRFPSFFT